MADQQAPEVKAPAVVVSDPNPDNKDDPSSSVLLETKPAVPAAPVVSPAPVAQADVVVEFEPTGDVGMDMALAFVGKAGIGMQHPAMVAATAGDFTILKATLAQKGVAGWEQFVALGEAAYARTTAAEKEKANVAREIVHKEAGGKEQWEAVKEWASANATDAEKLEINELLGKGGLSAKGAVKYLVNAYNNANNVEVTPRDATGNAGRSGNGPAGASGPLSPKDYAAEVGALNHKLNGRLEGSKEYAALQARRQMYRG